MRLNFPTVVIWTVLTGLVSGQNAFINGNQGSNVPSFVASAQASSGVSNFQNFPPGQQASASAFVSNGAPYLPNQNSQVNGQNAANAMLPPGALPPAANPVNPFQNFPPNNPGNFPPPPQQFNGPPNSPGNFPPPPQQFNGPPNSPGNFPPPPQQFNGPPNSPGNFPPPPQQFNGPPNSPGNFPPPPQQFNGPPNSPGNFPPPPQQFNGPPNSPGNIPPPAQQFNGPPNSPGNFPSPPQQFNGPPPPFQGPSMNAGSPAMQQPPLAANPFMNPQGPNSFPNTNVNPGNGNGNPPSSVFGQPPANPSPFNNRGARPNQQRPPFNHPPLNRPRNFPPRPHGNNMRNRNPNFRPNPPGPPNTYNLHPKVDVMPTASPDTKTSDSPDYSLPSDVPNEYPKVDFPKGFFQDMLSGLLSTSDGAQTTGDNIIPTASPDSKTPDSPDYSLPSDVPNEYPNVKFPKGFFQDMLSGLQSTSESEKTTGAVTEASLPQTTTKMTPLSTPKDENTQNQKQQNPRPTRFPNGRPPRFPNGFPRFPNGFPRFPNGFPRFPNGLPRRFPNRRRPNHFPHRRRPNQFPNRRRPNQFPNRRPNFPFRRPNSFPSARPTMIPNSSSNSIKGNQTTFAASNTTISDPLFQNTTPLMIAKTLSTVTSPDTITYKANTPTVDLSATLITVDNTMSNSKELSSNSISKDVQEITTEYNDQPSDAQTTNNDELMQSGETFPTTVSSFRLMTVTQKPYAFEVETSSASNSDGKINSDSFISEITTVMENFVSKLSLSTTENILTSVAHEENSNEITTLITKPDDFVTSTEQASKDTTNEISEGIAIEQVTSEVYKSEEPTEQSNETSQSYTDEVTSTIKPLSIGIGHEPPLDTTTTVVFDIFPDKLEDSEFFPTLLHFPSMYETNSEKVTIPSNIPSTTVYSDLRLKTDHSFTTSIKGMQYMSASETGSDMKNYDTEIEGMKPDTTVSSFESKYGIKISQNSTYLPDIFTDSSYIDNNSGAMTEHSENSKPNPISSRNDTWLLKQKEAYMNFQNLFRYLFSPQIKTNTTSLPFEGKDTTKITETTTPDPLSRNTDGNSVAPTDNSDGVKAKHPLAMLNEIFFNLNQFLVAYFGPFRNASEPPKNAVKTKNQNAENGTSSVKRNEQLLNLKKFLSLFGPQANWRHRKHRRHKKKNGHSNSTMTNITNDSPNQSVNFMSTNSFLKVDNDSTANSGNSVNVVTDSTASIFGNDARTKGERNFTDNTNKPIMNKNSKNKNNAIITDKQITELLFLRKLFNAFLANRNKIPFNGSYGGRKSWNTTLAHKKRPSENSTTLHGRRKDISDVDMANAREFYGQHGKGVSENPADFSTNVNELSTQNGDQTSDAATTNGPSSSNTSADKELETTNVSQKSDVVTPNSSEDLKTVDNTQTPDATTPKATLEGTTIDNTQISKDVLPESDSQIQEATSTADATNSKESLVDSTPTSVKASSNDSTNPEDLLATTTPASKTSSNNTATTIKTSSSDTTNTKDSIVDTLPASDVRTSLSDSTNTEDSIATTTPTSKTSSSDTATTSPTPSSDATNAKGPSGDTASTDVLGTSSSHITNPEDSLIATTLTSISGTASTNIPNKDDNQNKGITDAGDKSASDDIVTTSTYPSQVNSSNSGLDQSSKDYSVGSSMREEDSDLSRSISNAPESEEITVGNNNSGQSTESSGQIKEPLNSEDVSPSGIDKKDKGDDKDSDDVTDDKDEDIDEDDSDTPEKQDDHEAPFDDGYYETEAPPPGVECRENEKYYKCVPNCRQACFNFDNYDVPCPDLCIPGCFCSPGLVVDENGNCVNTTDCKDYTCKDDEDWWECMPKKHNTCKNFARAEAQKDFDCEAGCFCTDGLIQTDDGKCVDPFDCPDPVCDNKEEATDCMNPCNTCEANCHNCNIMLCREGCDCKDGYKRDSNGTCIHASKCPVCTTSLPTTENTAPVPTLEEIAVSPDINPMLNSPDDSQDETTPSLTPTKPTADSEATK